MDNQGKKIWGYRPPQKIEILIQIKKNIEKRNENSARSGSVGRCR